MKKAFIALMLLISGCSDDSLHYVGKVADSKFYVLHAAYIDGPNVTAFIIEQNGKATIGQQFSGPGVSTSLYPATAQVASSGVLKPSNFQVQVQSTPAAK